MIASLEARLSQVLCTLIKELACPRPKEINLKTVCFEGLWGEEVAGNLILEILVLIIKTK